MTARDPRDVFGHGALRGLGALSPLTFTPTLAAPALAASLSAAMRVADLWTRDAPWARAANTRLMDFREQNCCDGMAGCKSLYCLFQMWQMDGVDCTSESFAKYILQFDRFAKAQQELALLFNEPRILALGATTTVRLERFGNMHRLAQSGARTADTAFAANTVIAADPAWWANWVTRVMSLVAVARWSLNVRWTLVKQTPALWANERAFLTAYVLAAGTMWSKPTGCRDTGTGFSCQGGVRVPYPLNRDAETVVEGFSPEGSLHCTNAEYRNLVSPMRDGSTGYASWVLFRSQFATPSIVRLSDNATLFGQRGDEQRSCEGKGPNVQWGHAPLKVRPRVPVSELDFRPVRDIGVTWSPNWAQSAVLWPRWVSGNLHLDRQDRTSDPGSTDVVEMLTAWFAGWQTNAAFTDKMLNNVLVWSSQDPDGPNTNENTTKGYPTAITQVMYAMSLGQDVLDHTPGVFVEGAMDKWFGAYALLPPRLQALTPEQMQVAARAFKQQQLNEILSYYSATAGTVAAIVGAINPIAGLVVGIVLALVGLLIQFGQEICATLAESPPCLASPFVRFIGASDTQNSCDLRTTTAGGAAAVTPRAGVIGAGAGAGLPPTAIWLALNAGNSGITGTGAQLDFDDAGNEVHPVGAYVLGGVAAVALLTLGVLAFRRK